MTAFFLVMTMIWHDAQTSEFIVRRVNIEAPSGEMCEGMLSEIQTKWRKEAPAATIIADCLPVIITRKV